MVSNKATKRKRRNHEHPNRGVFPYLIPDISLFYGAYVSAVKTQEPLSSPRQRKTLSGWCILVMFAHWHDPPIVV